MPNRNQQNGTHECPKCHKTFDQEKGLNMHTALMHNRRRAKRPIHTTAPTPTDNTATSFPMNRNAPAIEVLRGAPGMSELLTLIKGGVAQVEDWFERATEAGLWTPEQINAYRLLAVDEFYRELFAMDEPDAPPVAVVQAQQPAAELAVT